MSNDNLLHKVFITGANRGMGLGYVELYLKKGISVVATTRNKSKSLKLLELKEKYFSLLDIVELDIADEESIQLLKERLNKKQKYFSVAINNAGICINEEFGKWTATNFEMHFKINTIGPALISQVIVPFMKKDSRLIQISSGLGSNSLNINPLMSFDAYAASKSALQCLTVRLSEKLRKKEIIVVAINPGWVQTDMGGNEATTSISNAVQNIESIITNLTFNETGNFISDTGEQIPW